MKYTKTYEITKTIWNPMMGTECYISDDHVIYVARGMKVKRGDVLRILYDDNGQRLNVEVIRKL